MELARLSPFNIGDLVSYHGSVTDAHGVYTVTSHTTRAIPGSDRRDPALMLSPVNRELPNLLYVGLNSVTKVQL